MVTLFEENGSLRFDNYNVEQINLTNQDLINRNTMALIELMKYKTSYRERCRFLLGSWLLTLEELEPPFNKKGMILINTSEPLVDVAIQSDIEIVLANSIEDMANSFYFHIYREDLVLLLSPRILVKLETKISIPKYSLLLSKEQKFIKKRLSELYRSSSCQGIKDKF
jgi:hypothetical protein